MNDTTADMALVNNALAGCQRSWFEIVQTHSESLHRYVFKDLYAIAYDIADVVQYFWMSMVTTRLAKYDGSAPLNSWLKFELRGRLGDLRKQCTSIKNTHNLNSRSIGQIDDTGHVDTPENLLMANQSVVAVNDDEKDISDVLKRLTASGISVKEISENTGMSSKRISDWKNGRAVNKSGDTARRLLEFNAQVMSRPDMKFAAVNWQAC